MVPSGPTVVTALPDFREKSTTTRFTVIACPGRAGPAATAPGVEVGGPAGAGGRAGSAPHAERRRRPDSTDFRMAGILGSNDGESRWFRGPRGPTVAARRRLYPPHVAREPAG